jgi:phage major head subunit gpT-like protein
MLPERHEPIPSRALKGYGFGRTAADAKNALKGAGFSQLVQSSRSFRALAPEGSERLTMEPTRSVVIPAGVDDSRSELSAEWRNLLL